MKYAPNASSRGHVLRNMRGEIFFFAVDVPAAACGEQIFDELPADGQRLLFVSTRNKRVS